MTKKPIKLSILSTPKESWDLSDCSIYLQYVCPDCNFICKEESEFKIHMKSSHKVKEEATVKLEKLDKLFNIEVIKKEETQNDQNETKSTKNKGITFDCNSCGFAFKSVFQLKGHIEEEHSKKEVIEVVEDDHMDTTEDHTLLAPDSPDQDHNFDSLDDNYEPINDDPEDSDEEYKPCAKTVRRIMNKVAPKVEQKPKVQNIFKPQNARFIKPLAKPQPTFIKPLNRAAQPMLVKSVKTADFLCVYCKSGTAKFRTHGELQKHLQEAHNTTKPEDQQETIIKVRCRYCQQDFRTLHHLKIHSDRDHAGKDLLFTKRTVKIINDFTSKFSIT